MNRPVIAASTQPADGLAPMSDTDFDALGRIVHERTGIVLSESKRWMLTSRLTREIRRLGLPDFASYRKLLSGPGAETELQALTSAVTTNVTSFFRGNDHFDALAALLPDLREKARQGRRVRIWSAACSTGQEPYSIAMTVRDHWPEVIGHDFRILATDIDASVIEEARRGVYSTQNLDPETQRRIRPHAEASGNGATFRMSSDLRGMIRFEQLNLLGPWPFQGHFDVIFCRNVVIYFDAETRCRLWQRLAERLDPGGWLFVGHSERVDRSLEPILRPSGVTRYRRSDLPMAGRMAPPAITPKAGEGT